VRAESPRIVQGHGANLLAEAELCRYSDAVGDRRSTSSPGTTASEQGTALPRPQKSAHRQLYDNPDVWTHFWQQQFQDRLLELTPAISPDL
jgi:hypothetical protein